MAAEIRLQKYKYYIKLLQFYFVTELFDLPEYHKISSVIN